MTLREALADPHLFGPHFADPSWDRWKIYLDALFAEAAPDEARQALYRECTGRTEWPAKPSTETTLIVGRRGGKSRILALLAIWLACFTNYTPFLAAGEQPVIAILAQDRDQAQAIFRYVVGFIETIPLLGPMVIGKDFETLVFSTRVRVEITTASFRSTRGRTYAAVLCDEVAVWRTDESRNPDYEIIRAIKPGLLTIPGAMFLMASSPYGRKGELFDSFRRFYGRNGAPVLVWKAPTLVMNTALNPAVVEAEYERDPEGSRAEFGAEFRSDLAAFVSQEAVDAVTQWGRAELPPQVGIDYVAFCDPSGGLADSMTLAIAHVEGDVSVLDLIAVAVPPFDPGEVVAEFAAILRRYGVSTAVGDSYAGNWPAARFKETGIEYVKSERVKNDIYRDFLPLITSRGCELLEHRRLLHELVNLERRVSPGGRDAISHPPNAHDDVVNAVAGALTSAFLDRRPTLVKISDLTDGDKDAAAPEPPWCEYVYLMVFDADDATIAAVFCGSIRDDNTTRPPRREKLYILDVELTYFQPGLFAGWATRLRDMGERWHVRTAVIFTPEHLAVQVAGLGMSVEVLPKDFKPELQLVFASEMIGSGLVRFCRPVLDRMSTKAIAAAMALRSGDSAEGALRAALLSAIWLKHAAQ
jgi:hypothetical protein